jgi:WD40 repeat protein/predicted Ser/Thr protein kinase
MNAPEILRCPECGYELPGGLPAGLCPRCALAASSHTTIDSPSSDHHAGLAPLPRDFGDYELLEEIARGGMGIVYRARQKSLDRIVAVKMILAGQHASHDFIKRFRIEASSAAALQHPNIVAIHEVGVHEGEHFLVMDYVGGPNLAQITREQPLSAKTAARYLKTAAEAIHYAHEKGLLHRDLKPSNVIIDSNDQPRVTDFGLAKRVGTASEPATQDLTQLTLSGHVLGSPGYMPPEQAIGARGMIGRRSDVYSLGAMLYHLLTGRPPFGGGSPAETLRQVETQEPVSLRLLNPGVPFDLETICLKCLEKELDRRYHTAKELADELGRFLNDEAIEARPVRRIEKVARWSRRHPALAGLVVLVHVVAAIGLAGILWEWRRAERHAQAEERERHRAETALRALQLQRVEDLLAENRSAMALAQLASIAREDPDNSMAVARMVSLLSQRNLGLPASPPLRHSERVNEVGFSPDGRQVVTASKDGTAQVWDARSGGAVGPALRHDGEVRMAGFSPDGRYVITASADHTARLWDADTGQPLGPPLVHPDAVSDVGFNAGGSVFFTTCADSTIRLWAMPEGILLHSLEHGGAVNATRFGQDGKRLVAACGDGTATVWNVEDGTQVAKVKASQRVMFADLSATGDRLVAGIYDEKAQLWEVAGRRKLAEVKHDLHVVECVAFSPDGQTFATAGRDHSVRIWDGHTAAFTGTRLNHDAAVYRVEFSRDGRRLLAQCQDGTAWLWDVHSGTLACEPLRHELPIAAAHLSPDGQWVAVAGLDGAAYLWDARPGAMLSVRLPHRHEVVRAAFHPDGRRVATASYDRTARIWDALTGDALTPPLGHGNWVTYARFDTTGERLLTSSIDGTAGLWSVSTGKQIFSQVRHGSRIDFAEFSPDGTRFVTTARNGTVQIWNATNGQPAGPLLRHGGTWIRTARFSPDSKLLVTASDAGTAQLWDVLTGKPLGEPLPHSDVVSSAQFSPDGDRLVTASFDMTAIIWSVRSGQALLPPLRHAGRLTRVAFSPDGKRLLTSGHFPTAHLWDAQTGEPLGEPMRHSGEVSDSAFSHDGRRVATITFHPQGHARIWDGFTGKAASEPLPHDFAGYAVTFSPDHRWLLTASGDQSARLWELPETPMPTPNWLPELAEAVAGLRRTTAGKEEFVRPGEFLALRERLRDLAGEDPAARWVRWFFADRSSRALSPHSPVTVPMLAERCLADGSAFSLREARRLFPTNSPAALALGNAVPGMEPKASPVRDSRRSFHCVDLVAFHTSALTNDWHGRQWKGNNLAALRRGVQRFGGVDFNVQGIVQLNGTHLETHYPGYPRHVVGIPISRAAPRLHFLLAAAWGRYVPAGTHVGSYVLHYADGQVAELRLLAREHLDEWQLTAAARDLPHAKVAWTGRNEFKARVQLFLLTWEHLRPDAVIESVDFVAAGTAAAPFMVAMTVE